MGLCLLHSEIGCVEVAVCKKERQGVSVSDLHTRRICGQDVFTLALTVGRELPGKGSQCTLCSQEVRILLQIHHTCSVSDLYLIPQQAKLLF